MFPNGFPPPQPAGVWPAPRRSAPEGPAGASFTQVQTSRPLGVEQVQHAAPQHGLALQAVPGAGALWWPPSLMAAHAPAWAALAAQQQLGFAAAMSGLPFASGPAAAAAAATAALLGGRAPGAAFGGWPYALGPAPNAAPLPPQPQAATASLSLTPAPSVLAGRAAQSASMSDAPPRSPQHRPAAPAAASFAAAASASGVAEAVAPSPSSGPSGPSPPGPSPLPQSDPNLPFSCELCSKAFARKTRLRAHLRLHTGERPFPCRVQGCSARFADSSNRRRHEASHDVRNHVRCRVCGKAGFTRHGDLLAHEARCRAAPPPAAKDVAALRT